MLNISVDKDIANKIVSTYRKINDKFNKMIAENSNRFNDETKMIRILLKIIETYLVQPILNNLK
jgi:hypothetical protein